MVNPEHLLANTIGLGLRNEIFQDLRALCPKTQPHFDFLELAPENWLNIGGRRGETLAYFADNYPIVSHGLSLSLGSPAPLNIPFIQQVKAFLAQYQVKIYSEHLSYCSDAKGYLYDLLPIPFTGEAVNYVASRIQQVQDILGSQIAVENISYYYAPSQELSESEFINAVLEEADCLLLLDVNNIYVNSVNHGYDAKAFLQSLPRDRISYIHIAGHLDDKEEKLLIDTHGAPVISPVYDLLADCYETFGVFPTLLERDNNLPPVAQLYDELAEIRKIQQKFLPPCGG